MRYRLLGNSGLRVSEAALGTMTFGEDWGWGAPKDEARRVYDAYREAGGNFIDTANVYTNGASESFLGEFMKDHRQSVVLATKYSNAFPGTDPNAAGNQRKNMVQAVEASLKRLETDYIDLYWVHIWDQITPVEEVMRALVPMARALNLGLTAWSPLAGGVLTGKYHGHDASPEPGRLSNPMLKDFLPEQQRADRVVAAVKSVSTETGASMAQAALAWLRSRPVPVIPIIGARKLSQLHDNLASFDVNLSAAQIKTLDDASDIDLGFPYAMYAKPFVRAIAYGGLRDKILA
jgi:aryl-alcohol dehydrogenase-like predicted oxidoreductase